MSEETEEERIRIRNALREVLFSRAAKDARLNPPPEVMAAIRELLEEGKNTIYRSDVVEKLGGTDHPWSLERAGKTFTEHRVHYESPGVGECRGEEYLHFTVQTARRHEM